MLAWAVTYYGQNKTAYILQVPCFNAFVWKFKILTQIALNCIPIPKEAIDRACIYSQHLNILCFYIPRVMYMVRVLSFLLQVLPTVFRFFSVIGVSIYTRRIHVSLLKHRETEPRVYLWHMINCLNQRSARMHCMPWYISARDIFRHQWCENPTLPWGALCSWMWYTP